MDCTVFVADWSGTAHHTTMLRRTIELLQRNDELGFCAIVSPHLGIIVRIGGELRLGVPTMLYIYSAKTLRAMLADAKQAFKLVDDTEAPRVQDLIDDIIYELSTRKD